jgi:hypothetical protein
MFAMLNGRWPRITAEGVDVAALETEAAAGDAAAEQRLAASIEQLVMDAVRAQESAGLDLVTDGQVRWADAGSAVLRALAHQDTGNAGLLVRTWYATHELSERTTAQAVPGPYSLGRRVEEGNDARERSAFTLEMAEVLGEELRSLAAAGCPMVLIEEPSAISIGADEAERALFAEAQARLLAVAPELHATLVINGGSAWAAGADTILSAPYRSYLFDLVAGPDNWYLVRAAPGDRGIVCGALQAPSSEDQVPTLVWAGRYAASANDRGPVRVGLANASPLESMTTAEAGEAIAAVARAARLAGLEPAQAVADGLDPRTYPQGHGRRNRRRRAGE